MAELYTDVLSPADITNFAREAYAQYESTRPSLAGFIPNVKTSSHIVDVEVESTRLAEPANWRAFDAEPEFGHGAPTQQKTFRLQPLSQQEPVGEYQQLIDANDATRQEAAIMRAAQRVVIAVAERVEAQRASVLTTGRLVINQHNVKVDESFGRAAELTATAATPWAPGVDILNDLLGYINAYSAVNGVEPGTLVISSRVASLLGAHPQFATKVDDGVTRPATRDFVKQVLAGVGIQSVEIYDRRNSAGRLIPDDTILLLPARGENEALDATDLGATYWGETATSRALGWDLAADETMGIVAGAYRNAKPPVGLEIVSDALVIPALKNANLSMAVKVL